MSKKNKKTHLFSILGICFIAILLGITIFNWRGFLKRDIGLVIASDIDRLSIIFDDINKTAGILGFDHQKNHINFLNIKRGGFVGSEVGSMNLIHPDRWHGPYEEEMPRMQEEDYMIVRTKFGYFITPGEGVRLPNGKIIGQDIIFDEDVNIGAMMHDDSMLSYKGRPLAAQISIVGPHGAPQMQIIVPEDGE